MKNIIQKLKFVLKVLKTKNLVSKDSSIKNIVLVLSCLFPISIFCIIKNHRMGYTALTVSSVLLLFFDLLCIFIAFILKKPHQATIIEAITISLVFTYFSLFETNTNASEGVAVLWFLLIPIISMSIAEFTTGFFMSLYFQILICVLCYVPYFKHIIQPFYSDNFLLRFPLIYLAFFITTSVIITNLKFLLYKQKHTNEILYDAVENEHDKVLKISLQTVISINKTMMAKDSYTAQHCERVARYSELIAKELGFSEQDIKDLKIMALLHDIGKISIPDSIILKKEPLTNSEYEIIKTHAIIGADILRELTIVPNINYGALYHHEHFDGSGYPQGLKGEDIPMEGRIIGIADAFDAMNSKRSYQDKCQKGYIKDQLKKQSGLQFDPQLSQILLNLIDRGVVEVEEDNIMSDDLVPAVSLS